MTERTYYVVEYSDGECWTQIDLGSYQMENFREATMVARGVSDALSSIKHLVNDRLGAIKIVKVEERRTVVDQTYRVP